MLRDDEPVVEEEEDDRHVAQAIPVPVREVDLWGRDLEQQVQLRPKSLPRMA